MVVYGRIGICRVEAVGAPALSGADESKDYYTLSLVHRDGRVYVPVDTRVSMRPVMSREAALTLIEQIPSIDESAFDARDMGALKQHYDSLLVSHDCADLVHVIKSVYVKRRALVGSGKSLGQVEAQYMRQAEEMLYDELSVALDIPRGEVQGYVEDAVSALADSSAC